MGKLKFTLSNILLYLAIIASCLLLEDVGFLSIDPKGALQETHFFMLLFLALGGYISYFVIEHIKNKVTLDYVLSSVLLMCFILGMVAIWSFNGANFTGTQHFEYYASNWDKVHQTLLLLVFLISTYSILFYFNKNHPSIRKFTVFYFIIIVICLLASIVSWIKEYDSLMHNLSGQGSQTFVNAFFWNPNMYSLMMLLGIYSCFAINYRKKNIIWLILILYFSFMIVAIASKTAIAVCFASLVLYFLFEIIFVIKRNQKRGLIELTIYLSILVSFVAVFVCAINYDLGSFSNFWKSIYWYFANAQYGDLSRRTFTWSHSVYYIGEHPLNLLFGFGFKNSNHIIGGFWHAYNGSPIGTLSAHSGYIQILMNFGIIGLLLYFLFFIYYFYCFIKVAKKDARFAYIYLLIGLSLMGYAVMESIIFLNTNTLGLLIVALFYLPMVNRYKHYKHKQLGNDVIEVKKPKPIRSDYITKSLAKGFMGLIIATISLFVFPLFNSNKDGTYLLLNIMFGLIICALFVPFITASIAKKHSRMTALILNIVNFVLVAAPIIYLGIRYYLHDSFRSSGAEWVIPVILFIVLIGETLIFGVAKKMKFHNYISTYTGMFINSVMGILISLGLIISTIFLLNYIDVDSTLTYIIYPVIILFSFYIGSYFIPFKSQKETLNSYNESLLYMMKKDVLKDRLGDFNELRRD